jgi:hypothetical protein
MGRNLNGPEGARIRLFDGLIRHRVTWIRELSVENLFGVDATACAAAAIRL